MYDDALSVKNRIITDRDLFDIFSSMSTELERLSRKAQEEYQRNQMYDYNYQVWTMKDFNGTLTFQVEFYDNSTVKFDKFASFMSVFNSRLNEIKYIYCHYSLSYGRKDPSISYEYISKHINLTIRENKMEIDVSIPSDDENMKTTYEVMKEKILSAPEKYDRIIRKKSSILNKIAFSCGLIPALVICTLLMIIPEARNFASNYYVIYPLGVLLLAYMTGYMFIGKIEKLYSTIVPDKKYAGYDKENFKSIYKDDVETFIDQGEILIGKNVNNLINRDNIIHAEISAKKRLKILLIVTLVLSIIVILL